MSSRTTLFLIFLLSSLWSFGQVSDDFSDGDFTNNPVWSGDTEYFLVNAERLESNGPAGGTIHLSTENTIMDYTTWEFLVDLNFNGTSSNFIRIYLTSNQADLEASPTGYFLQMGQTNADFIKFFRSDAGTNVEILESITSFPSASNVGELRMKITRDPSGNWELFIDPAAGTNFQSEGTVLDNTYQSTSHFGVFFQYSTASRFDDLGFDDLTISAPIVIDTVVVNSATELIADFNQDLNQTDAETIVNYSISGLTINNVTQSASQKDKVTLTLDPSTPLLTADYELTATAGLTKNDPTSFSFSYKQLAPTSVLTLSATELSITFNDSLDATTAENINTYAIDNAIGTPNAASLSTNKKTVTLTLATELAESINYGLTITDLDNALANSSYTGVENFDFVIPLIVDTVIVDDKNTVSVTFNKSINQTIVQTLTNYSIDGGIGNPSAVTLGTDGKSAILTFATDFADADYDLSFSNLEDLDGNVISTSGYDFSYLNLAVTSVTQSGELGATVTFNQEVNQTSAETLANYSLTEIGTPTSATLSSTDARQVTISWDKLYNSSYALTVSDIANSVSNSTLTSESKELTISKVSSYGQLLINELMADPSPVVGLPDAEFVEVYNPNDFGLNLKGFTLNGKTLSSY
ncbi:MAG: hypothetical protein ACI83W_002325, partial [Marinoscillum sp.]